MKATLPLGGGKPVFGEMPLGWGRPVELRCGKCQACRLENARVWAMRCMHEKRMHKTSCLVTLTYADDKLPEYGTLVPEDLKQFHMKLHKRLKRDKSRPLDEFGERQGIRYYACGEYGDKNLRPHYHSLIFGYDFPDKKFFTVRGKHNVFTSALLSELWPHGLSEIGEVTYESAGYVARYCMKKVDGKKREEGHYAVYDADGVIHERMPEFSRMSLKPGIGAAYFARYGDEILNHDRIIINGREVPSIRYYDKLIEKYQYGPPSPRLTSKTKHERNKNARIAAVDESDNTPERLAVKEELLRLKLKQKKRQL